MNTTTIFLNLCEIIGLERSKKRGNILLVAKELGKGHKTLSASLQRNTLPFRDILNFCEEKGWSPSWVFFNLGPKRTSEFAQLNSGDGHRIIDEQTIQDIVGILRKAPPAKELMYTLLNRRVGLPDIPGREEERRVNNKKGG